MEGQHRVDTVHHNPPRNYLMDKLRKKTVLTPILLITTIVIPNLFYQVIENLNKFTKKAG